MIFKDYIRKKLYEFLNMFKTAKVVFDSDNRSHVHTVDIYPHSFLERDDVFDWIDSFIMESIEVFPEELVCIKNPDSVFPNSGQGIELEGLEYKPFSHCESRESISSCYLSHITGSVMRNPIITLVDNTKCIPTPIKEEVISSHITENLLAA